MSTRELGFFANAREYADIISNVEPSKIMDTIYRELGMEFLVDYIKQITKEKTVNPAPWNCNYDWFDEIDDFSALIDFIQKYPSYYKDLDLDVRSDLDFFYDFDYSDDFLNDQSLRRKFEEAIFEVYQESEAHFYQWLKPLIKRCPIIFSEMEVKYHILLADYDNEEEEAVIFAFLINYKYSGNPDLDKIYFRHMAIYCSNLEEYKGIFDNLLENVKKCRIIFQL